MIAGNSDTVETGSEGLEDVVFREVVKDVDDRDPGSGELRARILDGGTKLSSQVMVSSSSLVLYERNAKQEGHLQSFG